MTLFENIPIVILTFIKYIVLLFQALIRFFSLGLLIEIDQSAIYLCNLWLVGSALPITIVRKNNILKRTG